MSAVIYNGNFTALIGEIPESSVSFKSYKVTILNQITGHIYSTTICKDMAFALGEALVRLKELNK